MESNPKKIFDKQIEDLIKSAPAGVSAFIRVIEPITKQVVKTGATDDLRSRLTYFGKVFKAVRGGEEEYKKLANVRTHRYQTYVRLGGYFTFEWELCSMQEAEAKRDAYETNKWDIVSRTESQALPKVA
jgi:hypothetical protein|tara:strand:- start:32 stop:418 length:387 start_codon:yes stop_codon:yes gene_type:complete